MNLNLPATNFFTKSIIGLILSSWVLQALAELSGLVKGPSNPEEFGDGTDDEVAKFFDDVIRLFDDVTLCWMILLGTILYEEGGEVFCGL